MSTKTSMDLTKPPKSGSATIPRPSGYSPNRPHGHTNAYIELLPGQFVNPLHVVLVRDIGRVSFAFGRQGPERTEVVLVTGEVLTIEEPVRKVLEML